MALYKRQGKELLEYLVPGFRGTESADPIPGIQQDFGPDMISSAHSAVSEVANCLGACWRNNILLYHATAANSECYFEWFECSDTRSI